MTEGLRVQCEEWVFDGKGWVPKSGKGNRQIRSCRDLDVFQFVVYAGHGDLSSQRLMS
jgi:hypothetical protein